MNEIVINFYWLLELFDDRGNGCRYADKLLEKVITDAFEAHRFATREEAQGLVDKAPKAPKPGWFWLATQHGFAEGAK